MSDHLPIRAERFADALIAAGVFHADEKNATRRIVIDAQAGHVVLMYVERYGDERLLQVIPTLDGVEIREETPQTPAPAPVSPVRSSALTEPRQGTAGAG
jgi:hypothetical protein